MKEKHPFESRRDVNASPRYTRNGFDDCLHKKCWFNVIKMQSGIWYKNCNLPWSTRDYLQRSSETIWLQTTGIIVKWSKEGTEKRDKTGVSVRANLRMKVKCRAKFSFGSLCDFWVHKTSQTCLKDSYSVQYSVGLLRIYDMFYEKNFAETFISAKGLNMDTVRDRDSHVLTLTSVQTCQTVNILGWTLSEERSATAHIHHYLLLTACLWIFCPATLTAKRYPHP